MPSEAPLQTAPSTSVDEGHSNFQPAPMFHVLLLLDL